MESVFQFGDLVGRHVVVRYDFNVFLDGNKNITDDGRTRAALSTLNELCDAGARIVILAHLGRPRGGPDPKLSLVPVTVRLGELFGARVKPATDVMGPSAKATVESFGDGEVALLEDVRFGVGKKSKDEAARKELVEKYAAFGDFFVPSDFGVVHRKEAPVCDIVKLLPSAAGSLIRAETDVLEGLTENLRRPFIVMLGGVEVADKLAIIDNLLKVADTLVIDGGTAFTSFGTQGPGVGSSLIDDASIEACTGYLKTAEAVGKRIPLPVNMRVASEVGLGVRTADRVDVVPADITPADKMSFDIDPATEKLFGGVVRQVEPVFRNGPMGVSEVPELGSGAWVVVQALTEINGISVVSGGDSASVARALGFPENAFGYVSTGGSASLELAKGKVLPGIVVLRGSN